jgi:serine/threonine-protein kinase RsbW
MAQLEFVRSQDDDAQRPGISGGLDPYLYQEPILIMQTLTVLTACETLNLTLDSTNASIDLAETAVCEVAMRAGFDDLRLGRICLAVREIAANAIIHGNRYHLGKKFFLTVSRTLDRVEVTIADQGNGFDLSSVPDPRSSTALLRPSGRGLYLARAFMDEFHVRRGDLCGMAVTLVKYVNNRT